MARPTIRKDALRSRRAILGAAHELLANGGDASFAEIAHAAELGQATVYRHFDNRQDLFAALAEEAMTRIEAKVAATPVDPGSFENLLRLMAREQARDQTLIAAIRHGEVEPARVRQLSDRARSLFRGPLAAAQGAGLVRHQVGLDDVMPMLAMIDGALTATDDPRERGRAASRAVDLLFEGLRA